MKEPHYWEHIRTSSVRFAVVSIANILVRMKKDMSVGIHEARKYTFATQINVRWFGSDKRVVSLIY